MDPKLLRTSAVLIGAGLAAALASLGFQSYILKKLAKQGAVPGGAAPPLSASSAPARVPLPLKAAAAAPTCKDKIAACLKTAGRDLAAVKTLGDCYLACRNLNNPACPDGLCGDRCEALFGVRDACP